MQTSLNQGKITRNDLIAFKSATAAAPTTEMQVNRILEKLQSSIAHLGAVAMAATTIPTQGKECARKGGHVVLTRSATNVHYCQDCGTKILSATQLRPELEANAKKGGPLSDYWLADGQQALHILNK